MKLDWKIIAAPIIIIALVLLGVWLIFFQAKSADNNGGVVSTFDSSSNVTVGGTNTASGNNNLSSTTAPVSNQKIFKVVGGPIAGATIIQTFHPTTTIARYVTANNGHVFDLVLDSPGAIPRAISNTTIPGIIRTLWLESGNATIVQYLDTGVVKSAYLGFPATTTASTTVNRPVRIQFLPDNIRDLATSPDGTSVAFLLPGASGVDGYTAKSDGTNSKKLFSLPLSEVLISWPATNTLLLYTKSAAGLPGMAFSVNTKTGAVVSLLYAPGLTAIADKTFSHIIYQTASLTSRLVYVYDVAKGQPAALSLSPIPEKCIWSIANLSTMYCAAPLSYINPDYLDLWHQGKTSKSDVISSVSLTGQSNIVAAPGGKEGGVSSDIDTLAASPDNHYLLFINRGERSLWGVRLIQ